MVVRIMLNTKPVAQITLYLIIDINRLTPTGPYQECLPTKIIHKCDSRRHEGNKQRWLDECSQP